jgi:hypothetical protein
VSRTICKFDPTRWSKWIWWSRRVSRTRKVKTKAGGEKTSVSYGQKSRRELPDIVESVNNFVEVIGNVNRDKLEVLDCWKDCTCRRREKFGDLRNVHWKDGDVREEMVAAVRHPRMLAHAARVS